MYTYACMHVILGCWSLVLIGVKAEDCKSLPKVITQCISKAVHIYICAYTYIHTCMYIYSDIKIILSCWILILIGVKAEDCKSLPKVSRHYSYI